MRFDEQSPLPVYPIGRVISPFTEKMAAPRQGALASGVLSRLELFDDPRLEHALEGLEDWSHLWVLFWFDRDPHFSPKVQPPRGAARRGVFGTRSPHRPNPIGLSPARLIERQGSVLVVSGLDLLDQTPVLDLKPYVPYADRIAEASDGWLETLGEQPAWKLDYSELVERQFEFLQATGIFLRAQVEQIFEAGPEAHRSRRIRREGTSGTLALKDFRLRFRVEGRTIEVLRLESGYSREQLERDDAEPIALHRQFVTAFV